MAVTDYIGSRLAGLCRLSNANGGYVMALTSKTVVFKCDAGVQIRDSKKGRGVVNVYQLGFDEQGNESYYYWFKDSSGATQYDSCLRADVEEPDAT